MHVVAVERDGRGDGDRLLAGALHVEAGLALPLGAVHAVVEDAHRDHVAQHLAQRLGVELGVPRADRLVVVAEHADERGRERDGFGRRARRRRGAARRRRRGSRCWRNRACRRGGNAARARAARAWARCGANWGPCRSWSRVRLVARAARRQPCKVAGQTGSFGAMRYLLLTPRRDRFWPDALRKTRRRLSRRSNR